MAIRKVARLGHPILRAPTRDLSVDEIRSEPIRRLVNDMIETMHEYGGVGLAAPQVHESLRLAVIEMPAMDQRYPEGEGGTEAFEQSLQILFNARVEVLDEKPFGFWEGCLSVPGLRGYVERPRKVRLRYVDGHGQERMVVAEDFTATVIQHELDHLDASLFVDKIAAPERFAFFEEYQRYHIAD
ncbi:MAG: peptide deformylase [Myxococcales bacterium]|nr:peptide deformylase [Myxococcales bacterium]